MQFTKVHGAGNDFIVVADLDDAITIRPALVRALCDRHRGVGADGLIRLTPAEGADVFMDYRNADGGVVEMCGNGVRCVATYVLNRGLLRGDVVRVGSRAGVKVVDVTGRDDRGRVVETRVDMGAPRPLGTVMLRVSAPGADGATDVVLTTVSMGNPHAVVEVDDIDKAPVTTWGPRIERDPAFPDGTNVEFIAVPGPDTVRGRIWERGVGETLASGTGASAMAAAAHLLGLTGRRVRVELPGGVLHADWSDETLHLRGPAVEVFDGAVDDDWVEAATRG
jgi:diaminopimelate epimerase